jgi:glycosyltransferase involved in cell wall biosynthesis
VVNPFDQLPNETDVPLRYWALSRTFAAQGHEVIWWSSDFSHLTKSKRQPCPDTDGFSIRLIKTPPYRKNISFARLKNHKAFADGFYADAMAALKSGELKAPDRIVVSLPPLGVAEQAFRIRNYLRELESAKVGKYERRSRVVYALQGALAPDSNEEKDTANRALKQPCYPDQSSVISHRSCQVIIDIMDAWPETFYQALPKPLRKILGPILVAPLHRSAKRAYQDADKISAVGQSYLDLASRYLGKKWSVVSDQGADGRSCALQPQHLEAEATIGTTAEARRYGHPQSKTLKPMFLCYHGTDLDRFQRSRSEGETVKGESEKHDNIPHSSFLISNSLNTPLRAVYLGAMGSGYDLQTIIDVAAHWKAEGTFPFQIHFAGDGPQIEKLKSESRKLKLLDPEPSHLHTFTPSTASSARVVFHGFLQKEAITDLLLSSDVALVPNRPDSLVACPYKAGEYAAAGLPMISCLRDELNQLLSQWNAGSGYNEGDVESLHTAFKNYSTGSNLLNQQSCNTRKMAEALFDREKTYSALAEFILETDE